MIGSCVLARGVPCLSEYAAKYGSCCSQPLLASATPYFYIIHVRPTPVSNTEVDAATSAIAHLTHASMVELTQDPQTMRLASAPH